MSTLQIKTAKTTKRNFAAIFLVIVGILQMTGDLLRVPALKAVGAALGASPAPKVFSAVEGLETFSTRFFIDWTDVDGKEQSLELTPEVYSKIKGPYNRRNVYGAVFAYAPILASNERTAAMFHDVTHYAFCDKTVLLKELGIDPEKINRLSIRLVSKVGTNPNANLPLNFEISCHE
jgi:hypothetical protein